MTLRRRLLTWATLAAVAFAAGFASATLLTRSGATATVRGQTGLYAQVLQDLQRHYYQRVDVARLGQSGIAALLKSLHDPYTVYFTPKQSRLFSQELQGTYTGIGAALAKKGSALTVTRVFNGSPAAKAGVHRGDVIVAVDGTPTATAPAFTSSAAIVSPTFCAANATAWRDEKIARAANPDRSPTTIAPCPSRWQASARWEQRQAPRRHPDAPAGGGAACDRLYAR